MVLAEIKIRYFLSDVFHDSSFPEIFRETVQVLAGLVPENFFCEFRASLESIF